MVKQIAANVLIIFVFLVLTAWTIVPFLAETRFDSAARLDPLNAKYRAKMGKFYIKRAAVTKNKIPALLKAETEYKKAHELNPYSARYLMELAGVEARLFLSDNVARDDKLGHSIGHFKEA
ncbi:MAG: hypothetical protein U9R52_04080, partial [Candidatus Omnitrophota bacterium]|nr:hypothetical protein [Candidatus Omnitrophota bacterium]